ncbi:MAG: RluA family pseudouridine synthase [Proteobacteria bacterium]|nr:RluA family pseudouridine synthase [Pseudomonadota bacterium]
MSRPAADRHKLRVGAQHTGARLDRFIADAVADLSRSRVKALILEGRLALGRQTITDPAYRVKPDQLFMLTVPPPVEARPKAEPIPLSIMYEDAHLIVLDKPAGLVVHPAPGNPNATLVNALIAHCGESLSGIGGERRPGIVHRLDKATSGLMVAAKTDRAHRALVDAFAARKVKRTYTAVIWGVILPPKGEIEGAIGRSPVNRKKMAVRAKGGKPALTRYRTLRRLATDLASVVECRLATGRTHQIRVHFAHKGHPLVGDPLYGGQRRALKGKLPDALRHYLRSLNGRQALHARLLGFRHPVEGSALEFESSLPDDMTELIERLDGAIEE